jgi:hypothetical protein
MVASWAGGLMGRRSVDLLALRLAFERSGLSVTVTEPAKPDPPEIVTVTKRDPPEPDPPRCHWVLRWPHEPVAKVAWDYDPWSKERLK